MPATGEGTAPWLAPGSLGRMADVLAADLSRLEPSSATTIAANLGALKQKLLTLKAGADMALAEADDLTAAPNEWTPERAGKLALWLKANGASVVLLDTKPGAALAAALEGLRPVLLSTVEGGNADAVGVKQGNLEALKAAFKPQGLCP